MGNDLFERPRYHDNNDRPEQNSPGTMGAFDRDAMAGRSDPYGLVARVSRCLEDVRYNGNEIVLDYDDARNQSQVMDSLQDPFINSYMSTSPSHEQLHRVLKGFDGQEQVEIPPHITEKTSLGNTDSWASLAQQVILGNISNEHIAQILHHENFKTHEENQIKFKTEYNRQIQLAEERMKTIGYALTAEPVDFDSLYSALNSIQSKPEGDLIRHAFKEHLIKRGEQEQNFEDYISEKLKEHYRQKEGLQKDQELSEETKQHIEQTVKMLNGFDPEKAAEQLSKVLGELPSQYQHNTAGSIGVSIGAGITIATLIAGHGWGSGASKVQGGIAGVLGGMVINGVIRDWDNAGNDNWYRDVQRLTAGLSEAQKNQIRERFEGISLVSEEQQQELSSSFDDIEIKTLDKESLNKLAEQTLDMLQGDDLTPEEKSLKIAELSILLKTNSPVQDTDGLSAKDVFDKKMGELIEDYNKETQQKWEKEREAKPDTEREEWEQEHPKPVEIDFYSLVAQKSDSAITGDKAKQMFTEPLSPDAIASVILSETEIRCRALNKLEGIIGTIDQEKEAQAKKRLQEIRDQKSELTEADQKDMYLQREVLRDEIKNIPNVILGARAESDFDNISLSQEQIEAVKNALEQQISAHKALTTNLDFAIEDRVRPRTIYDKKFTPGIPITIVSKWKDSHGTPVGSELRDPKKSPSLYSDNLP